MTKQTSFIDLLLILASLIIGLIAADILCASLIEPKMMAGKSWWYLPTTWGNCYATQTREPLHTIRVDPKTGQQDFCVIYDAHKRKKGFFPERPRKAALVGDSFTFGEGIVDEGTLGYFLGQAYDQFNFLNYGAPGMNINQIFDNVRELLKEQIGVSDIVYFYNINDMLMSEEIQSEQRMIMDFQNVRWGARDEQDAQKHTFLRKSSLFRVLDYILTLRKESRLTVKNYLDMYSEKENDKLLKFSTDLLLAMNSLTAQQGAKLHIVIYPLLYKDLKGAYPFLPIHTYMMDFCRKNNLECIDGYQPFKAEHSLKAFTVHQSDYHPNGKANRLLVDYLAHDGGLILR